MAADLPKHAIRDGDYRVIYVVGHKGLYKYFPDANYIAMMKNIDFAGGEVGQMVGYGALTTFPPAGGVRVLIPTRDTSPGGLWILDNIANASTAWILKNGGASTGGANPLPEGWEWHGVAASPVSGKVILLLGHKIGNEITATAMFPTGMIVDSVDNVSPMWLTIDGGDNWHPVPLPAPYLYSGNTSGWRNWDESTYLTFSDTGTPLLFALTYGVGNFDLPGLAQWWGNPTAMQVRAAAYDGVSAQGPYYFGNTDAETALGLTFGSAGEAVMSAHWGGSTGPQLTSIGWTVPNAHGTLPITGANYVGSEDVSLYSLDTIGADRLGIVGVGVDGLYYSADYRTVAPVVTVTHLAVDDLFTSCCVTLEGVVAVSSSGVYLIRDIASGTTPELQIARTPGRITSARQLLRRIIAARIPASDVLEGTNVAQFVVFDGDSWTTIDGPSDLTGRNAKLAITAIAVTEG